MEGGDRYNDNVRREGQDGPERTELKVCKEGGGKNIRMKEEVDQKCSC